MINLLYTNDLYRGPGKVVQNLIKGLQQLDIEVVSNPQIVDNLKQPVGMLQLHPNWRLYSDNWSAEPVVGPNLFVLPSENKEFCKSFRHFIVPSQWVYDLYRQFSELDHATIDIWAVGVDTEKWKVLDKQYKQDCFIYFKNRSEKDLMMAQALCKKLKLSYKVIKYGEYKEEELLELCKTSKFCVIVNSTESQGLAYLEILSTNTPCYVFNQSFWNYDGKYKKVPASSVPYFDSRCGAIANTINISHFTSFINDVDVGKNFNSHEYILENFTLKQSAQNYIDILTKHGI